MNRPRLRQSKIVAGVALFAVVTLALALGCGSDDDAGSPAPATDTRVPPPVSKTIGPAGGSLTTADGVELDVPEGALEADTEITVSAEPAAPLPAVATGVGVPYTFGPEGLTFAKPVTITLPWAATRLPAGKLPEQVVVITAPKDSVDWIALPRSSARATGDAGATTVTAETTHFSTFAPATITCPIACAPDPSGDATSCSCVTTCLGGAYSMTCAAGACTCQNGAKTITDCAAAPDTARAFESACDLPGAPPEIPDAGRQDGAPDAGDDAAVQDASDDAGDAGDDGDASDEPDAGLRALP